MENSSLWQKTTDPFPDFPPLRQDLTCEAVVVGAGLTGILTAWMLQEQGMDVVLLESGAPGQGATGHTTAKITAQHGLCYADLISAHGKKKAGQYARANWEAVNAYAELIKKLGIDCDFRRADSFLYSRTSKAAVQAERDAAVSLGIRAELVQETELPFPIAAAVKFPGQACFHPLKFLSALLPQLRVYAHTTARSVQDGCVQTNRGTVRARHIVIATRFPFFLTPGLFFARMHQERSYALSISGIPPLSGMYMDAEKNGVTFRPWQDQIILGGRGHRTGTQPMLDGYEALKLDAQRWYPGSEVTAQWSTEDGMPADQVPYIGGYEQKNGRIYVAAGFQKWGMTTAMAAARILTDQICGQPNENAEVFSPHRLPVPTGSGQVLLDGGISAGHLFSQAFYVPREQLREIAPGHGGVVLWNGRKVGAYHSEDDRYYLVSTRCPHMGCQLSWNQAERSWDCPCHGSRFSYDGKRIDPPAAKELSCRCLKK